jgi:hypothetical protein
MKKHLGWLDGWENTPSRNEIKILKEEIIGDFIETKYTLTEEEIEKDVRKRVWLYRIRNENIDIKKENEINENIVKEILRKIYK